MLNIIYTNDNVNFGCLFNRDISRFVHCFAKSNK